MDKKKDNNSSEENDFKIFDDSRQDAQKTLDFHNRNLLTGGTQINVEQDDYVQLQNDSNYMNSDSSVIDEDMMTFEQFKLYKKTGQKPKKTAMNSSEDKSEFLSKQINKLIEPSFEQTPSALANKKSNNFIEHVSPNLNQSAEKGTKQSSVRTSDQKQTQSILKKKTNQNTGSIIPLKIQSDDHNNKDTMDEIEPGENNMINDLDNTDNNVEPGQSPKSISHDKSLEASPMRSRSMSDLQEQISQQLDQKKHRRGKSVTFDAKPKDLAKKQPSEESEEEINYKSRALKTYNDTDSQDNSDGSTYSVKSLKKGRGNINYLKSQEYMIKKELENTQAMIEVEKQKIALGANSDVEIKPNKRFKNYNDIFSGLTKSKNVVTLYPIVSVMITYNSVSALTVTKQNDSAYYVKQYSLESYKMTFEEKIGDGSTGYIKLKDVEQNADGTKFALAYYNDGYFKLRTFGNQTRTPEEIEENEFDVNEAIGINNFTMPISNFADPFINCCFCTDTIIFVCLYYNAASTHHHFFFDTETRQIHSHTQIEMNSHKKNFPYKSFFSGEEHEIFVFYRQGQAIRIPFKMAESKKNTGKEDYILERMTEKDLGQMFLINGTALVARSSSQILFFKMMIDDFTGERKWMNYRVLDLRGFVYFIKGNKRIQVITDSKIYFFLIDPKTFEPNLENVMDNFMGCTMMMFGSKVRYCITFKTNQKSFDIYRRKFQHDYMVNVIEDNFDGSIGLQIESMNAFLVSKINKISFYDVDSFEEVKDSLIEIPLLAQTSREINEIISMQISQSEDFLAIVSGNNLVMNEQRAKQIFIYKKIRNQYDGNDKFVLHKRHIIKDRPEFDRMCMKFYFKNTRHGRDADTLIFAKKESIIEFNFETDEVFNKCYFEIPLTEQPQFFLLNDEQDISIISSHRDGIYYNHINGVQVDLDNLFQISSINQVIHDNEERCFYLLCNKHMERLGVYLIKFDELQPKNHKFFMKWKNKLDISDANVWVLRNKQKKYKELIVSYKTIFINTYNVKIIDISNDQQITLFRHESFQLWESSVQGFYLSKNKDFISINKSGINILSLGSYDKRVLMNNKGQELMTHSLESASYLKVDSRNFLLFECSQEDRVISIMQQYTRENSKTGEETDFECIYKVRLQQITLRELLLFQSIYVCKTQSDILKLVLDQPEPAVFYKSFFELDCSNMVSILSFDSRSMRQLLRDDNNKYFQTEYPLFYKNKIQKSNNKKKFFYRSAIDSALRNNQIRAITFIINYIVKYQNNYVSSFLFERNIEQLINKGVEVADLFSSKIFYYQFDFDEWPSTHTENKKYMRPYNEPLFNLRKAYRQVFWEDKFEMGEDEEQIQSNKLYKVSYILMTLSSLEQCSTFNQETGKFELKNEGVSLMALCFESDEIDVFNTESIQELIQYKWNTYAKRIHLRGFCAHAFYVLILMLYVYQVYIEVNEGEIKKIYSSLLIVAILYPAWYESFQLYKMGPCAYFGDIGNYSDIIYTYGSVLNVYLQNTQSPQNLLNKCLMTLIFLQQIVKTFFFLRIFETLSYIVTMINRVIFDLRVFLLFYSILVVLFSMIYAVIGVGNKNVGGFKEFIDGLPEDYDRDIPNEEYDHIGLFFGYIISTLRQSLGDFDFEASMSLTAEENVVYWIIWILTVLLTCIIFLNFIIAEASASYESVKSNLTAMIMKEKASLIFEAEDIIFESQKDEKTFPARVIIRKIDN